jgi:ABC-type phosphate transport system substrate-binding protein
MKHMEKTTMKTWNKQLFGIAVVLGISLAFAQSSQAADIVIIANNNVKPTEISQGDARDVFLGESNSVGGSTVAPVVLQKGPAHDALLAFVGKNEGAFDGTWRKQVFTGKGSMPHACESEDALIAYVSATPGAIGYVSAGKSPAGVKILKLK